MFGATSGGEITDYWIFAYKDIGLVVEGVKRKGCEFVVHSPWVGLFVLCSI